MTAKEMFEKYAKENDVHSINYNHFKSYGCDSIQVVFNYSDSALIIEFDSCFETIRFDQERTCLVFGYEILQAIQKQIEELGWVK